MKKFLLIPAVCLLLLAQTASPPYPFPTPYPIQNDTSTGTSLYKLADLSSGNAIISNHSNSAGAVGVVVGNAGTTGSAYISAYGPTPLYVDGTTTVGHCVVRSTTTDGEGHDTAAACTSAPSSGEWVGIVTVASTGANSLSTVNLKGGFSTAASAGSSAFSALTGSTNTTAAMLVGAGASLEPTSTGIVSPSTSFPPTSASGAAVANLPGGWTIRNGAVLNDFSSTMINVHIFDGTTTNRRFVTRTLTVPYHVTADMLIQGDSCSVQGAGVYLYDGTKVEGIELSAASGSAVVIRVITAATVTGSASIVATATNVIGRKFTVDINNQGTNRVFGYYSNGAFVTLLTEASGTFLTETSGGPGGNSVCSDNGKALDVNLLYWVP